MQAKKNPQVDISGNSSLYFAIGLNIMLFFTYSALEFKTYDKAEVGIDLIQMEEDFEDEIPITEQIQTPPPPPPPQAAPEVITIVEDIEEIEETVIESTESDQDDKIADIIEVDEVEVEDIEEDVVVPFSVVENVPIFPGCKGNNEELRACFQEKMTEHLKKNFRYPETALEMGIYGKVFVMFDVNKEGVVSKIRTRGPDKLLEAEAKRIISLLPKMTPGKQRGKPVRVPYSIPINFQLLDN